MKYIKERNQNELVKWRKIVMLRRWDSLSEATYIDLNEII